MKMISKPFDLEKVHTIIYHLPNGEDFAVDRDTIDQGIDFGYGDVCDTSEIDGVLHFFPRGNA